MLKKGRTIMSKKVLLVSLITLMVMALFIQVSLGAKNERYVFVSIVSTHPFWIDAKEGGEAAATQLGVKFEYTGPAEFDPAAQATTMEQIIATKPAGIITTGHNPQAITPVINKAIAAGIPVFTIDTDAPDSERFTYIGTDNYEAGKFMGRQVAKILNGKGKIGVSTQPGQFNLEERLRGVKDAIAKFSGLSIVATADNKSDDSIAATAVEAMLQANPDMNMVLSMNATGAGVATAIRETKNIGKVHAVVFDVTDPILKAVKEGVIDSTIAQRVFLESYLAVKMMYDYNHGNMKKMVGVNRGVIPLPGKVDTGVVAVTKANADAYSRK
jgi:ribose transport system substrate-binding protein